MFFRKNHDYSLMLAQMQRFSELLWSIRDTKKLQINILRSFRDMCDARSANLLLYDQRSGCFEVKESLQGEPLQQKLNKDDKVLLFIQKNNQPILKSEILNSQAYVDIRNNILAYFSAFQADLIVPLWFEQKLLGMINLGVDSLQKDLGEKLMLMQLMAGMTCVALDHAGIYAQLIEKKHQLQHCDEQNKYYEQQLKPDLNTSMKGILSLLELVMSENTGPLTVDQRRYLEMVQGACGGLLELASGNEV